MICRCRCGVQPPFSSAAPSVAMRSPRVDCAGPTREAVERLAAQMTVQREELRRRRRSRAAG